MRHNRPRAVRRLLPLLAVLLASVAVLPTTTSAQTPIIDERAARRTFVIAYPDTTTNTTDSRQETNPAFTPREPRRDTIACYIYSPYADNEITITGPGYSNFLKAPVAGQFLTVFLNGNPRADRAIVSESGMVSNKTFRIESIHPIIVYCYIATKFGAEAWTPIPVDGWGREYFAAARQGEVAIDAKESTTPIVMEYQFDKFRKPAPAEILVVAAYDNTVVTFMPRETKPQIRFDNNPQLSVVLKKNEAYQVQSFVDTNAFSAGLPQPDLGGTYIYASKPIGVISGNTRAQVNDNALQLTGNSYKNPMIEWLTPIEQHGTEFVYTPTWDDFRPTGRPGEDPDGVRQGENVRVYATSGEPGQSTLTNVVDLEEGNLKESQTIDRTEFHEFYNGAPIPHVYRTDRPAQAYMNSTAVVKLTGRTGGGAAVGLTFEGIGPYMVELTPREQWPNVAPFIAPLHPPKMRSYINYVTDSFGMNRLRYKNGGKLTMNRGAIPGTPYFWGTRVLDAGETNVIIGDEGATFFAFVYGSMKGWERYRPGRTKKDDDDAGSAGNRDRRKGDGASVLHPSEYEESTGLAFGYPLAPSRMVLRPGDSLLIERYDTCGTTNVKILALNERPVGLRAIRLDSAKNARLGFLDPPPPEPVIGRDRAEVVIRPIDELQDASAVLVVQDRTGRIWRIPYRYYAERVDLTPAKVLDFQEVTLGTTRQMTVEIVNPLAAPVDVHGLSLLVGTQSFTIDSSRPAMPATLAPGETIKVWISVHPTIQNMVYEDSLRVQLGCTKVRLALRAETVAPCLYVDDLDFKTLRVNERKTMKLRLVNKGRGSITFNSQIVSWLVTSFEISQADIDRIGKATLGPGESIEFDVTFSSPTTGTFRTVARFWASTRDCRDTSVWKAVVTKPGPQITGYDWENRWVTTLNGCTKSGIGEYSWNVTISNDGERPFRVAKLELIGQDAADGYFKLDAGDPATRVDVGDEVRPGEEFKRLQKVLFLPKDERAYTCTIRLTTEDGEVVENFLSGVGIESHVAVGDHDFGTTLFTGVGTTTITGSVDLQAGSSRDLTVTELRIDGADAAEFEIDPTFARPDPARPATWWLMRPGDVRSIPITFRPTAPGSRRARILALGDHSRCDAEDSTGSLTGSSYTLQAASNGHAFDSLLTCDDGSGTVTVRNLGSAPLLLRSVRIEPAGGPITITAPTSPVTLQPAGTPGDAAEIPVRFTPTASGSVSATVFFEVTGADGSTPVMVPPATVTGVAYTIRAAASARRDVRSFPGTRIIVPVTLDGASLPIDRAGIREIRVTVTYDEGMMLLDDDGSMLTGTVLNGWSIGAQSSTPGSYSATLTGSAAASPLRLGTLLNLPFRTFLGSSSSSEVIYTIDAPGFEPCVTVVTKPGSALIDSVCGLNFRLIERIAGARYALPQNRPNPVKGTLTSIEFSLGLDGPTTLVVYNAAGEKVATLVDAYLEPGTYTVSWDARTAPSGLYYYRLSSGAWSRTNMMMIDK